nr:MAG TPA: hypothetical protein [Caudoviricetes sp.]
MHKALHRRFPTSPLLLWMLRGRRNPRRASRADWGCSGYTPHHLLLIIV